MDGPSSSQACSIATEAGNETSTDYSSRATTTTNVSSSVPDADEKILEIDPPEKADDIQDDIANAAQTDMDNVSEASAWSLTPAQPGWGNYARRDANLEARESDSDSSEFDFLVPDVQAHYEVLNK